MTEIIKRLDNLEAALKRLDMGNVIFKELTGHYGRLKEDMMKEIKEIRKLLEGGGDGR